MRTGHTADLVVTHPAIGIVGRVMCALIFFLSGITHFTKTSFFLKGVAMTGAAPLITQLGVGRAERS